MPYCVYDEVTGAAVSFGRETPPSDLPAGLAVSEFAEALDFRRFVWDATARAMVPKPPVEKRRFTKLEFRSRLTLEEQVALDLASIGATVEAATFRVILASWAAADYISLDDPRTEQAVGLLVQAGLLTPERGAALLAPEMVTP